MHSPTAVTPEPTGDMASSPQSGMSYRSFDSITGQAVSTEQGSFSLTPSPLAVRSEDIPIYRPGFMARKNMQDMAESTSISMNNTPNKSLISNQTPLRSAPFLTPPSSDERPTAPQFALAEPLLPALTGRLDDKIPLTEKILAQSALYSQAVQRQHAANSLRSDGGEIGQQSKDATLGPFSQGLQSIPRLTYHQLQQQQQQQLFNRHSPSTAVSQMPPQPNASDNIPSFTAVELPPGSPMSGESETKLQGEESDGSKHIASIPKADPLENPFNTTNVYINGLPLHWKDEDLYRLTSGFGAVKSVKLFTRHLEDKPSAYGFVLFNCVEDAERFIVTLRHHTQFHPSFAKTAKVPGTTNAKHAISDPILPLSHGEDYADISITGLPLTIDMQTLRAFFSPQVIKASKFFHTTGTPRRLVGFIRLESKQAADEIIERLHGSSVLGWSEELVVKSVGFGNNSSTGFPNVMPDMLFPSVQNGLGIQSGLSKQPIFDTAPIQFNRGAGIFPNVQPPLPTFDRPQDDQSVDFSRLLGSMDLMGSGTSRITTVDYTQQLQRQKPSFSLNPANQSLPSVSFQPSPLLDLNQLHAMAPRMETSIQQPQDTSRIGLGISAPAGTLGNAALNNIVLQQLLQKELAKLQLQQQQQHNPLDSQVFSGTTDQALQALQVAVAMQNNGSLGSLHSATPTNFSPVIHGQQQQGGHELGSGFGGLYRQGMKIPNPLLSTSGSKLPSLDGLGGMVPQLLPALTPSSPLGSSEEPSPVTPTFIQLPRILGTSNENMEA